MLPSLKLPSLDRVVAEFDTVLRTLAAPAISERPHPDAHIDEAAMTAEEKTPRGRFDAGKSQWRSVCASLVSGPGPDCAGPGGAPGAQTCRA